MRLTPLLEVLAANLVLVGFFFWVTGDNAFRISYWGTEGFTPTTARFPLFFISSAVKGTTSIPGLLTVDWQQVIVLLLVVIDGVFAWGLIRSRRNSGLQAP